MSRQIQIRRGSATENNAFTGAIGEVTMDTTNKTLRVHDGTTAGGIETARKDLVANLSMPGEHYIDLTLGASGTTYTAPTDGYVALIKGCKNTEHLTLVRNKLTLWYDIGIRNTGIMSDAVNNCVWIPVAKNDQFCVLYNATGTTICFRFIYAKGAN